MRGKPAHVHSACVRPSPSDHISSMYSHSNSPREHLPNTDLVLHVSQPGYRQLVERTFLPSHFDSRNPDLLFAQLSCCVFLLPRFSPRRYFRPRSHHDVEDRVPCSRGLCSLEGPSAGFVSVVTQAKHGFKAELSRYA